MNTLLALMQAAVEEVPPSLIEKVRDFLDTPAPYSPLTEYLLVLFLLWLLARRQRPKADFGGQAAPTEIMWKFRLSDFHTCIIATGAVRSVTSPVDDLSFILMSIENPVGFGVCLCFLSYLVHERNSNIRMANMIRVMVKGLLVTCMICADSNCTCGSVRKDS
jgi:hypothetical protein